ncbi:MAG: hypothetical protein GY798_26945 [Hyphomicrobiales bacterium]|nr:hypothetical protein [Hyphomicrobiales bacterium]
MDFKAFRESLKDDNPPEVSGPLLALWHAAKGDWHRAHEIVQSDDSEDAAWVHAHLHRVEGDHANAGYWYRRAGKSASDESVADEAQQITAALFIPR